MIKSSSSRGNTSDKTQLQCRLGLFDMIVPINNNRTRLFRLLFEETRK